MQQTFVIFSYFCHTSFSSCIKVCIWLTVSLQKMIDKLKSMGPNNGPAQVNDCSCKNFIFHLLPNSIKTCFFLASRWTMSWQRDKNWTRKWCPSWVTWRWARSSWARRMCPCHPYGPIHISWSHPCGVESCRRDSSCLSHQKNQLSKVTHYRHP